MDVKTVIEKPMLFSGPMVRAILDGRKTQTRRTIKPQPDRVCTRSNVPVLLMRDADGSVIYDSQQPHLAYCTDIKCPHPAGSRIWVRETWFCDNPEYVATYKSEPWRGEPVRETAQIYYKASEKDPSIFPKWRPSIFMPRWAARVTLEVTGVRVQRLQEISQHDAASEGVNYGAIDHQTVTRVDAFIKLWSSINGPDSWTANPLVWVYTFKVLDNG